MEGRGFSQHSSNIGSWNPFTMAMWALSPMSRISRYRLSSGIVVSQRRRNPAVWRSRESDIKQGSSIIGRGEKILKAQRMGAISLLPFPFSLLIRKSRLSTLANAGTLNTSSGVASGQADPFSTSALKSKNFPFASSEYYLS